MRRREFITLASSAAIAWPFAARAQQAPQLRRLAAVSPVVALGEINETEGNPNWRAFFSELRRLGYVEGRDVIVERFSAEAHTERYADLAREVISRNPDVVVTAYGPLVRTFQSVTATVPIVGIMGDPIVQGIVSNLARPGGNVTGVSVVASLEIWPKRLQILLEVIPTASRVAFLASQSEGPAKILQQAAEQLGITLLWSPLEGPIESRYRRAFEAIATDRVHGLIVYDDAENWVNRRLIVELAEKARLPAIYPYREFFEIGGLVAYGANVAEGYRRMAGYVDQIFRGTKPGDLPIHLESKFELLVNAKAAKVFGVTIPTSLILRADEVIE
jgi:putative tryptophan/tyrosine transport system substrate-binding protein